MLHLAVAIALVAACLSLAPVAVASAADGSLPSPWGTHAPLNQPSTGAPAYRAPGSTGTTQLRFATQAFGPNTYFFYFADGRSLRVKLNREGADEVYVVDIKGRESLLFAEHLSFATTIPGVQIPPRARGLRLALIADQRPVRMPIIFQAGRRVMVIDPSGRAYSFSNSTPISGFEAASVQAQRGKLRDTFHVLTLRGSRSETFLLRMSDLRRVELPQGRYDLKRVLAGFSSDGNLWLPEQRSRFDLFAFRLIKTPSVSQGARRGR